MIFTHYRRTTRAGRPESLAFVRIIVSWVLLFTFIGSTGTAIFAATHKKASQPKEDTSKVVKQTSESSTSQKLAAVGVKFSPKDPVLKGSSIEVTFKVSAQTQLQILGHYSQKVYKNFDANDSDKTETFKYKITSNGEYDVVAKRGNKKVVKHLTVTDGNAASSSSVYSTSNSSSVVSSSAPTAYSSSQRSSSYSSPSYSSNRSGSSYSGNSNNTGNSNNSQQEESSSETGSIDSNEYANGQ
ncbi:hypothetical protein [Paucilactobacillus hokkaidonensis]|nr:hypothetical protein [Paucilactobacillus hokkaidonensis]KRO08805.1 hypothetical protein IV59_GL001145 [Paucilactobacillus hokkaidonensis]